MTSCILTTNFGAFTNQYIKLLSFGSNFDDNDVFPANQIQRYADRLGHRMSTDEA